MAHRTYFREVIKRENAEKASIMDAGKIAHGVAEFTSYFHEKYEDGGKSLFRLRSSEGMPPCYLYQNAPADIMLHACLNMEAAKLAPIVAKQGETSPSLLFQVTLDTFGKQRAGISWVEARKESLQQDVESINNFLRKKGIDQPITLTFLKAHSQGELAKIYRKEGPQGDLLRGFVRFFAREDGHRITPENIHSDETSKVVRKAFMEISRREKMAEASLFMLDIGPLLQHPQILSELNTMLTSSQDKSHNRRQFLGKVAKGAVGIAGLGATGDGVRRVIQAEDYKTSVEGVAEATIGATTACAAASWQRTEAEGNTKRTYWQDVIRNLTMQCSDMKLGTSQHIR